MGTKRQKAVAQDAPQTIEQATALLATYRLLFDEIAQTEQAADEAIALIKTRRDEVVAPWKLRMKAIFGAARAWWAVAGEAITEGKRKSADLAGVLIGERTSTPKLVHPGMDEDAAVERLLEHGWDSLVVVKHSLDKPAILAVLKGELAGSMKDLGFEASQKEEFFLAPVQAPQTTETVEMREAA